ncbi:S-adenosyl-L-methionine-dependent tRNA 4-demethylwyosine synthase TYW1-like, partial [Pempheris klunzingeri]|uniref:S-adenosyl-L-methionine-dependent tRNA 4-demethylwyosine synthase TYW1-like n=1 Tax=Pempheris klunzingeri TaxID=3127111 RepID=UPI00397FD81C
EPIMYPQINDLIDLLHEKEISTFLVTNAQFPDAIRNLVPVTQMYVSIDASNRENLKAIDRPLFSDFWERFISSLEYLRKKQQRTVYRLTLIKDYNMDDVGEYAKLIEIGHPSFVEIKGVTYSGYTNKQEMTMKNVPYHKDVVDFGLELANLLENYELCVEHEHSNSVLLSHKKFYINGSWHTWIDYDKFQILYKDWKNGKLNEESDFNDMSYIKETPEWALFNSEKRGFDPNDTKFERKNRKLNIR